MEELSTTSPKVAVLMLSWLRFDMLLETLTQIPKTCSEPLHLCLRVQGSERLDEADRAAVSRAAQGFATSDIYYTLDNIGTAAGRLDLTHRCCKYRYLMFTDDDITFPNGGIDEQVRVLDTYPEVGSCSLRPGGIKKIQVVSDNGVLLTSYSNVESSLAEVYLIGSASLMFRSLLYTKYFAAPDPAYYIGTWDWDFILQIRSLGYKVVVITNKAITNRRGGSIEYRKKRRNKHYVNENRKLFMGKWGFDPIKSRRVNRDFVKPVNVDDRLNPELAVMSEEGNFPAAIIDIENPEILEADSWISADLAAGQRRKNLSSLAGSDWRSRILRQQRINNLKQYREQRTSING